MSRRQAQIIAVAVEIQCPYCGEPLPEVDTGSFMWEAAQYKRMRQGRYKCDSCDEEYEVFVRMTARIE